MCVFIQRNLFFTALLYVLFLCHLSTASAQQTLNIDIFGPGQNQLNLVMAKPLSLAPGRMEPPEAGELESRLRSYLEFMPFLRLVPGTEILGGDVLSGVTSQVFFFLIFVV